MLALPPLPAEVVPALLVVLADGVRGVGVGGVVAPQVARVRGRLGPGEELNI